MINTHYTIYVNNVLRLANTLLIKSDDSVNALNQFVDEQAMMNNTPKTDYLKPTSWKYYKNISGEYHYLDVPMNIISLDTLETIEFSKENLYSHIATASAYRFGSRLYTLLVNQFPEQELLIKGILYPANIDEAIEAKDGTILSYPNNLVESNEVSLIYNLQKWIYGYKIRWYSKQFGLSDNLYPATALGIMYLNIVITILNLRLEKCKTNEAHSFHVRQYLLSNGLADNYIDNMTIAQTLFFYRNINYLQRNAGKQEIFNILVEKIMTDRNMSLSTYEMRHDLTNQPNNIYSDLIFHKKKINDVYDPSNITKASLEEILYKQREIARDNYNYEEDYLININNAMKDSLSNKLQTKILENNMIDESDSSMYSLSDILINHWLFLSANGNYKSYINIVTPNSGEYISITAKDAFILAWYALCNSIGINAVYIPKVLAKRVQRIVPHKNSSGRDTTLVGIGELSTMVDPLLVPIKVIRKAISIQPEITTIISTKAFYDLCVKIHESTKLQRNLIASQEHNIGRAMTFGMVCRIYSDNVCELAPADETYSKWLSDRSIDLSNLDKIDLAELFNSLTKQATGISLINTNTVQDLQKAMIGIMTHFSSYTVQYITTINSSSEMKTDWTSNRVGDLEDSSSEKAYCNLAIADVLKTTSSVKNTSKLSDIKLNISNIKNNSFVKANHDSSVDINSDITNVLNIRVLTCKCCLKSVTIQ